MSFELQETTIHGHRVAYRLAGSGPLILLIHGIGDNSTTWETVQARLAQRFTVIAVDLLGHGQSDKPRADYSVAAYANGMRDLLSVLDIERATVVGHSLGGGVAMQFAYQFPHLVERLVLIGAGGVTKDVNIALRLAALPMGSEALALLRLPLVLPALQIFGRAAGLVLGSTAIGHDLPDVLRVLAGLPEPMASAAFTRTLRAGTVPAEVTTDQAPAYPRVLDELIPSALHTVEGYANNPVETDHGRLKARLRPMRGLKRRGSARIITAGHAFVQNLRRGHYELATDMPARHRIRHAFDQLTMTI